MPLFILPPNEFRVIAQGNSRTRPLSGKEKSYAAIRHKDS